MRVFKASLLIFLALLVSCSSTTPTSVPTRTPQPPTTEPPPEPTPTTDPLPPNTFGTVDATTLEGKLVVGYQGWFGCPTDDSGRGIWWHWTDNDHIISVDTLTIDTWPDTSEYTEDELCPTGIKDTQGNELFLYSAYHPLTVRRHVLWMAQYGIDVIELQRFLGDWEVRNQVLKNIRESAEEYGRAFYIQYDGMNVDNMEMLKEDWKYIVDTFEITSSPAYLHHNGLPVVGFFGLDIQPRRISPEQVEDLLDFFQNNPDPKYRATVLGGVQTNWRTLHEQPDRDPGWAEVYRSMDILNPWHPSYISSAESADYILETYIIPDIEETNRLGIGYMPTIAPGYSWRNLSVGPPMYELPPLNGKPRDGGQLMWKEAYNNLSQGVQMMMIAMYDENDEATGIYKVVETAEGLPPGDIMLALDADGYTLPSDWYLILAGRIGQMLRGEMGLTPEIEDLPERDLSAYQSFYITFSSSSDWNALEIENSEIIKFVDVLSTEGELSDLLANHAWIHLSQPFTAAENGNWVSTRVQFFIKPDVQPTELVFTLAKGNFGEAHVLVSAIVDGEEIVLGEFTHTVNPNDPDHRNTVEFSIPF